MADFIAVSTQHYFESVALLICLFGDNCGAGAGSGGVVKKQGQNSSDGSGCSHAASDMQTPRGMKCKYDLLFENLPLKLFVKDRNSVYLSCHINYAKDLSISPDEIVGRSDYDFYPKELADKYIADDKTVLTTGNVLEVEEEYRKTGQICFVRTVKVPVKDQQGNIAGIEGCFWDISENRLAELALCEREEHFRLFYEKSPLGYQSLDENGFIIDVNPAWLDLLGYSKDEVLGRWIGDFVTPSDRELFKARFPQFKAEGKVRDVPFEFICKDGRHILVAIDGNIGHDVQGRFKQTHCVLRDITGRRLMEQRLEKLISKLEGQNNELERFASTVSHDLKSPLITITGFVNALEDDVKTGDSRKIKSDIGFIKNAAEKMRLLLEELLNLSRAGRSVNDPKEVSLAQMIQEVLDINAGLIQRSGVAVDICKDLPTVRGDKLRLREVLQNLLENSIKYMGDQQKPHIEIGAVCQGPRVIVFVKDNGMGIESDCLGRVFGLFDKLNPQSEGSGLGLSLVRRIVEVHGGKIWAESAGPGRGSKFSFTLPLMA